MATTDLAVREQNTLELIDSGAFAERVAPLLPDTLPVRRFLQVAKTAIRTNPDLREADQRTLMGALIRCAQDGLVPDGREAALNIYSTKKKIDGKDVWVKAVQYLPMIGGLRKNLAEYGWTLKTRVVFANDDFEYIEEPPTIRHVPVRPGGERGPMIAVYAVARHRDGRKLQIILDAEDVAKRRNKAKTDNVWNEWPEAMWEKSAGHAIFDEIPRAERDRMIVPADNGVDNAVELLYGPDGQEFPVRTQPAIGTSTAVASSPQSDAQKDDGASQQAEDAALGQASSAPGPDDDPEPQPPAAAAVDLDDLAGTVVPGGGAYAGKTLAEVAETQDGREWIAWALRNRGRLDADFFAVLEQFVEAHLAAEREAA